MGRAQIKDEPVTRILPSTMMTILAVAITYAVVAQAGFFITTMPGHIAAIFPSAGVALAAVLILGRAALVGVALGSLAANMLAYCFGFGPPSDHDLLIELCIDFFIAIGATAGAGLGAFLVRRFCRGQHPLHDARSVLALVTVGGFGCCTVSPTAGVLSLSLSGIIPWKLFGFSWLTWWLGDAAGTIIAAPLILAWHHEHTVGKDVRRRAEAASLAALLLLLSGLVFLHDVRFEYGFLPLLCWSAFRFGMRGASTAVAFIAVLATIATAQGRGVFASDSVNKSLLLLHSFLSVNVVSTLALAGVLAERKRAEEGLLESEAHLDGVSDNLPGGMVYQMDTGVDGEIRQFLHVSAGVEKMHEVSAKAVLSDAQLLYGQIGEADRPRVAGLEAESMRNMTPFQAEVRMQLPSGSTRWSLLVSAPRRATNGHMIWDGIELDITERRQAENALRNSEAKYRDIVENAPMGIFKRELEGNYHYLNPGLVRQFECKTEQEFLDNYGLISQRWAHPDKHDEFKALLLKNRSVYNYEVESRLVGGATRWFSLYAFLDDSSQFINGFSLEITDRKQVEEALNRRAAFDAIITRILAGFASCSAEEVDGCIRASLEELARFVGVDSAVVAIFSPDQATWSMALTWSASGIPDIQSRYQDVPMGPSNWAAMKLLAGEAVVINSIDDIPPEAVTERQNFLKDGMKSRFALPLRGRGGRIFGAIGFRSYSRQITWKSDDFRQLRVVSDAVANVLERKQAEEALRESEAQYRHIVDNAPMGIFRRDLEGKYHYSNPGVIRQFECKTEKEFLDNYGLISQRWAHPEKYDEYKALLLENRRVYGYENELRLVGGATKWFALYAFLDGSGQFINGFSIDITERKRAEESLKIHAARLKNLHRIDQAILQAVDTPAKITQEAILHLRDLLNCQFVSVGIYEFEKKEARVFAAIGKADSEVQTGRVFPEELYGDLGILRQNQLEIIEDIRKRKAVPAIINTIQAEGIRSSINAPIGSSRGLIGALSVGWHYPRAITPEEQEIASEVASEISIAIEQARLLHENKRHAEELEQRVRERTAELLAANQELNAFSYAVSHDLRQPLRAMIGFSQALVEDYGATLPGGAHEHLDQITLAGRRMGELIDGLLRLSRSTRGELQRDVVNLSALATRLLGSLAAGEPERRVTWTVAPGLTARGDERMIEVVLANLLGNAWKYTAKTPQPNIEVGALEVHSDAGMGEGRDTGAAPSQPTPVFFVRDNGAGFDPKHAARLFQPFQRLHREDEFHGTGIGLATVQRIVHRHGGTIRATGAPGQGATFSFTLSASEQIIKTRNVTS